MEYHEEDRRYGPVGKEITSMSDTLSAAQQAKQVIIDEIKEKLTKANSAVVVDYIGISVEEANQMRKDLREGDVDYTVYKNTLVKRALEGTGFEELEKVLAGPSGFALSYDDVTAPARILKKSMDDFKKMEFKGGVIEGVFYDAEGLKAVANIPSRDVLIAKFLGSIQSPLGKVVRTFQAIADAKAEGGDAPAAPAEAPAEEAPAE